MRPSSKNEVLEAATRVARRDGISAITFTSVSKEANLSRGGIHYHYPAKDDMISEIFEHLATSFEQLLLRALGKPIETSTPNERIKAYLSVAVTPEARSDLALLSEPSVQPEVAGKPWREVLDRWAPTSSEALGDENAFNRYLVRLIADGLWIDSAFSDDAAPPRLVSQIEEFVDEML